MNLKKAVALTFITSALAFAQQEAPVEAPAETTTDQAAVVSAPVESTPEETAPVVEQPSGEQSEVTTAAEPETVPEAVQPPAQDSVATVVPAPEPVVIDSSAKPVVADSAKQVTVNVSEPPKAEPAKPAEKPAEKPAAKSANMGMPPKTPFTVIHGNSYNIVENEAAADNVDLLLKNRLVKFAGQKFVYVEPAGKKGVVSLGNFFGAMDLSANLGRATIGYANYGFAADLRLSLGQLNIDDGDGKKRGTSAGDDWGLTLSKVLGGYVVTASADWITFADEIDFDPKEGPKQEQRYRDLTGSLIVSDGPVARKHFWSAGVAFVRHVNEMERGDHVVNEDVDSRTTIVPVFNYGTPALRSDRANLYLGLNTSFPIIVNDAIEIEYQGRVVQTSEYNLGMTLVPNIVSEVLLNKYVMFFGETNYEWNVLRYIWGKNAMGENYAIQQSVSDKVNASIGVRFQYDNLVACEFAFGDSFFTDTKAIFNGEGVFIKFGGFIYF